MLTPDPPQRRRRRSPKSVEAADFGAMVRRMVTAYGKRVAAADVEDLAELLALDAHVRQVVASTIEELREHQEVSWSFVAEAAGTSRQAAQQRWGRRS